MMEALEQLRVVTPDADQPDLEARIDAINRYIDEIRGRFGIV